MGSIMNVARTLWVPRDIRLAARIIAEGKVLAMDMGRIGDRLFLEASGVGLDAGLFGYFDRFESGAPRIGVLFHLALVGGGRPLPPPRHARTLRATRGRVSKRRGRPLPVHADGDPIGVTPVEVYVAPAALRVIVGPPEESGICASDVVGPVGP